MWEQGLLDLVKQSLLLEFLLTPVPLPVAPLK